MASRCGLTLTAEEHGCTSVLHACRQANARMAAVQRQVHARREWAEAHPPSA